jgi:RHS repeat-associated protein
MLYFQYDAESRLVCADSVQGGCNTQYIYNAEGDRVAKKTAGSITNQYLLDSAGDNLTELDGSGAFVRGEIDAGLTHLGTYFNGSTYFEHGDWLGTMRLRTGLNNEVAEQCSSLPFGDSLNCTGAEPSFRHFTGKERDSESGLDYFGERYYENALGRFATPDYLGYGLDPVPVPWADLKDPRSLNLYGYVRNNPVSVADPDGHDCVVQSRSGSNTEHISVTSGNCDNVKVGDGQTKTFVDGTVTSIKLADDGHSIDIGFRANDGSGAVGVTNANFAPVPDHPGMAYYWGNNAQGFRTLSQASMTADRIGWATVGMIGAATCAASCSAILGSQAAAQGAANAQVLRIMAFLESRGIPATVAAVWATRIIPMMGTQPGIIAKAKFDFQLVKKLNEMVREYVQTHTAH